MKVVFRIYCNEGYDIFIVKDMYIVLNERLVRGNFVVVCFINELYKNVEVKKIESFSKFYNFCYECDGVRVWRCYGIGEGKFIFYDLLIVKF